MTTDQMTREEALSQLNELSGLIEKTNQILFPGKRIMVYAAIILLIPVIEYLTTMLTFGKNFGSNAPVIIGLIHIVFYFLLFRFVRFVSRRTLEKAENTAHPILETALAFHRPVVAAIVGTVITLPAVGLAEYTYPIVFIFFGLLFNYYGRFSEKLTVVMSWSLIVGGFIFALATKFIGSSVWIGFNTYFAICLLIIGRKNVNERVHL